jgi:hypothetical protein
MHTTQIAPKAPKKSNPPNTPPTIAPVLTFFFPPPAPAPLPPPEDEEACDGEEVKVCTPTPGSVKKYVEEPTVTV